MASTSAVYGAIPTKPLYGNIPTKAIYVASAGAATYYYGNGGNDTTGNGLTPATAWFSPDKAVASSSDGDTLTLLTAGYLQPLETLSFTSTSPRNWNSQYTGSPTASSPAMKGLNSPVVIQEYSVAGNYTLSGMSLGAVVDPEYEIEQSGITARLNTTVTGINLAISKLYTSGMGGLAVDKFAGTGYLAGGITATVSYSDCEFLTTPTLAAVPATTFNNLVFNNSSLTLTNMGQQNVCNAAFTNCSLTRNSASLVDDNAFNGLLTKYRGACTFLNCTIDTSTTPPPSQFYLSYADGITIQDQQPSGAVAGDGNGPAGLYWFRGCVVKVCRGMGTALAACRIPHAIGAYGDSYNNKVVSGGYLSVAELPPFLPNQTSSPYNNTPNWGTNVSTGYCIQAGSAVNISYDPTPLYTVNFSASEASGFFYGIWAHHYSQQVGRANGKLNVFNNKIYNCYGASISGNNLWDGSIYNNVVVSTSSNLQRTYGHLASNHNSFDMDRGGTIVSNNLITVWSGNTVISQNPNEILASVELDHSPTFTNNRYFISDTINTGTANLFRQETVMWGAGGYNQPANMTAAQWFALEATPNVSASPLYPFAYTKTVTGTGSIQTYAVWASGITIAAANTKAATEETIISCPASVLVALSNLNLPTYATRQSVTYYCSGVAGAGSGWGTSTGANDNVLGDTSYSKTNPWNSLAYAATKMQVGDFVIARAGTLYNAVPLSSDTRLLLTSTGLHVANNYAAGLIRSMLGNILTSALGSILH